LIDKVLLFRSFCWIEIWYFKSKDINYGGFKSILILKFNTSLGSIEESKKFSKCSIFTLLIFSGIFFLLMALILVFYNRNCIDFSLNTKISWLFFIPEYLHRNFFITYIILDKCIILCIIDMEWMTHSWTGIWCSVWNYTDFFTIRVYCTAFYVTY
jgi:hypothetical protein